MKKLILIIAIITASTTIKANSFNFKPCEYLQVSNQIEYQPVKGYYQFRPEKSALKKFSFGVALTVSVFTAGKLMYDGIRQVKTGSTFEPDMLQDGFLVFTSCLVWTIHYSVK